MTTTQPPGLIVVISGPSGVGKGTVHARLRERFPGSHPAVSATTRPPRANERDGVDYHFVDEEGFLSLVADGAFLEHAEYAGNRYGTLRSEVEPYVDDGGLVILDIDVQGALQIAGSSARSFLVFLVPPSERELQQRLRSRGTEDPDTIARRLDWATEELAQRDAFDLVVVNDDLDRCVEEVSSGIARALQATTG